MVATTYDTNINTCPKEKYVLYYSRHQGTMDDFTYFASHLKGMRLFFSLSPQYHSDYGMSADRARELVSDGYAQRVCKEFDTIIISDTIPDARPFMNIADNCSLVLQVTNRFDFGLVSNTEYIDLVKRISGKVKWGVNNPWEPEYMKRKGVDIDNATYSLIRPSGHSSVPVGEANSDLCSVSIRTAMDRVLARIMDRMDIPFTRLKERYGGPKTLALYRCWIHIPYQVSVMKMMENLDAGVTMLIPSPQFFEQLSVKYLSFIPDSAQMVIDLKQEGKDWKQFSDFYCDQHLKFFHTFDSWDHLKEIIMNNTYFSKERIISGQQYANTTRREAIEKWANVLSLDRVAA